MQLLTVDLEKWNEIAPFVDSVCLPIYSIVASDPEFSFKKMQEIEQIASQLERRITGRLLLVPAVCVPDQQPAVFQQYLTQLLNSFHQIGFSYAITISTQKLSRLQQSEMEHFPFQIAPALLTEEQIDEAVEQCYQQVLQLWVKNTQMEKTKK